MTCDPNLLTRASSCLRCLTEQQLFVVRTYLLCQWAQRAANIGTPDAPSVSDITVASNQTNVVVTWVNGASMGSMNEIWKSTDGTNFSLFASVGGGISSHADTTGMVNGNIWYYKVRACNGTNCSAFTSVVSASYNYTSPNVASISFPTLIRAFGAFSALGLVALTSVSLPALKSIESDMQFGGSSSLATISFPNLIFLSIGGLNIIDCTGCALNAASVNQILARGVASNLIGVGYDFELAGGTNAAPSGQGVADKATLQGQGNIVNSN